MKLVLLLLESAKLSEIDNVISRSVEKNHIYVLVKDCIRVECLELKTMAMSSKTIRNKIGLLEAFTCELSEKLYKSRERTLDLIRFRDRMGKVAR